MLKVEAAYPMAYKSSQNVDFNLPCIIDQVFNASQPHSALGYLSP